MKFSGDGKAASISTEAPRVKAMSFSISDGVSFCTPGNRTVFLDVLNDRYLTLTAEAEQAFRRLISSDPLGAADCAQLQDLVASGLLQDSPGPAPSAARARAAARSLFQEQMHARARDTASALAWLARTRIGMALRPLRSTLRALREAKLCADLEPAPPAEELSRVAAAFSRCSMWASPLDRCLPRSVAAARLMIERSLDADFVIGVRLQPFSAHCWVQHQDVLINETLDRVRNYTPILVV
jgi:hypothetical protein